ncbi:MAG: BolA family protein [Thiohalomonadales bacterium]
MQDAIKAIIETGLVEVQATVVGDGSHFEATVVGVCFEGKSLLQKQKMVYALLSDKITNGEIHAITIKAYTPEEWQKASRFQVGSA